jgi:cell division cycle protein 37
MSKGFNYSKWDNIELSDDESDCHPNIDKESWFRMKHRSRVEREDNEGKDKTVIFTQVRIATPNEKNETKLLIYRV